MNMGCTSHKHQNFVPIRLPTINGHLSVRVQEGHVQKKPTTLTTLSPYLKLTMSNQQFVGKTQKKAGLNPFFNQDFDFVINSCYKPHGHSLQVQLWDQGTLNDKLIGMGILDLEPIINSKEAKARTKVYLNHHCQEVGYVSVELLFQEYQIETLALKFEQAEIIRKTSHFSTMKCWVQVVLGEEVLRTKEVKDKEYPPAWQDEILLFNVPKKLVKHCWVVLYDSDTEVGRLRMPIAELMESEGEQQFLEELEHKGTKAAMLKFKALKGDGEALEQFMKTGKVQINPKYSSVQEEQDVKNKENKEFDTIERSKYKEKPKSRSTSKEKAKSKAKAKSKSKSKSKLKSEEQSQERSSEKENQKNLIKSVVCSRVQNSTKEVKETQKEMEQSHLQNRTPLKQKQLNNSLIQSYKKQNNQKGQPVTEIENQESEENHHLVKEKPSTVTKKSDIKETNRQETNRKETDKKETGEKHQKYKNRQNQEQGQGQIRDQEKLKRKNQGVTEDIGRIKHDDSQGGYRWKEEYKTNFKPGLDKTVKKQKLKVVNYD